MFMQTLELMDFKARLEQSHTRAVARVEAAALDTATWAFAIASKAGGSAASRRVPEDGLTPPVPGVLSSARLRFNEDLAHRPAWLPPPTGSTHVSIAEWWDVHSQCETPGKGLACCAPHQQGLQQRQLNVRLSAPKCRAVAGPGHAWWLGCEGAEARNEVAAIEMRAGLGTALRRRSLFLASLSSAVRAPTLAGEGEQCEGLRNGALV